MDMETMALMVMKDVFIKILTAHTSMDLYLLKILNLLIDLLKLL
jgi:hypothetical protein